MAAPRGATRHGLRLTLGGAPNTPHAIPGVPGYFWPDFPTPVGGEGDAISLDAAHRYHDDPGMHLELVEYPASDEQGHRDRVAATIGEARTGIAQARRDGPEGHWEADRIADHIQVTTEATPEPAADAPEEE